MKGMTIVSSSPGRAEKLPTAGLALLLRGKSGSRSRARSSPMFATRSRSVGRSSSSIKEPAIAEEGEPSSPKVTCIGQVRIRRKMKNKKKHQLLKPPSRSRPRSHCSCRLNLFKLFSKKTNPSSSSSSSCSCRFFSWRRKKRTSSAARDEGEETPSKPPIAFVREIRLDSDDGSDDDDYEEEEETKVFVQPATPPKNALLLMRCRSAPHNRSSALATCRFAVSQFSPPEGEEEEREDREEEEEKKNRKGESEEKRCSTVMATAVAVANSPAQGLMRCKSEPGKTGEKLMEVSYCKWIGSGGERERRQMGVGTEDQS